MPQDLNELEIGEVSLVDRPANSSEDPTTGVKMPHARVALFKRDGGDPAIEKGFEGISKEVLDDFEKAVNGKTQGGKSYPKSDFAYTPDEIPSHWKLRLTKEPGGKPDSGIVGAAIAALGKGFRGNKVAIPKEDRPAVISRVRAAWKQANPDKGGEELPEVLKGDSKSMDLVTLEKKFTDMEVIVTKLNGENEILKKERELVLKMSKKQRKAYAAMDDGEQKAFMATDSEEKRKSMCDTAMKRVKEKALEDSMDEALKSEFRKAGPSEKIVLLAKQAAICKAESDKEGDSNEDDMEKKKAAKKKAQADDGDDEDDDENENLELKKKVAKLEDLVHKSAGTIVDITKAQRLNHFTKYAEDKLPNTAGNPIEKGQMLQTLADTLGGESSDVYKKYVDALIAADQATGKLFGEVGKVGASDIPAEKIFMAKAEEISKRDKIDMPHAVAKAMDEAPELYMDYERGHQNRRRSVA